MEGHFVSPTSARFMFSQNSPWVKAQTHLPRKKRSQEKKQRVSRSSTEHSLIAFLAEPQHLAKPKLDSWQTVLALGSCKHKTELRGAVVGTYKSCTDSDQPGAQHP